MRKVSVSIRRMRRAAHLKSQMSYRPKGSKSVGTRKGGIGRATMKRKSDYARVVEANETPIVTDGAGLYSLQYTTQLSEFQRAQEVAHAYKYYRCAKVELEFVPYANFATTAGVANARLPQIYFTVDRVANVRIAADEAEMQERGISPKLWRSTMKYTWRPNLLQHVQIETSQPTDGTGKGLGIDALNAVNSVPLFNKWLPTQQSYGWTPQPGQINAQVAQASSNPYALKYYGACAVIDVEGATQVLAVGDLIQKVTWEFKGPRALKTNAPIVEQYTSSATSMINPGVIANEQPTNYP